MTESSNDLVAMMREFGVEVRMLGTEEEPSPNGLALGAMLMEIHRLRNPAPTPPGDGDHGGDAAAKWEDPRPWRAVADAYDEAYAALDDPMNFHDNDSRVAGVKAAVAKAVDLGLVEWVKTP